jgi:hypothetical protein
MLSVLSHVRRVRKQIEKWNMDKMIKHRAENRLGNIISELGSEVGDEKFVNEIESKLNQLENWFLPDQLYNLYWTDLKKDVESLLTQAKPEKFPAHHAIVKKLHEKIEEKKETLIQKQDLKETEKLDKAVKIEEDYAMLLILWERRKDEGDDSEDLKKLFALFDGSKVPTIDDFFAEADDIAWDRLEEACESGNKSIEFISPRYSNIHPLRVYQLIQFSIAMKPRSLGNNYLFKHGLEYHWSLSFNQQESKEILTRPVTKGPHLVQYVPQKGNLQVAVELCRKGVPAKEVIMNEVFTIKASEDFGWRGAFRSAEVTALVIATLFAVVSGLASFYISNPTFGNIGDYITLFIWGAGIDQGKNFLQHLQKSSSGKDLSS